MTHDVPLPANPPRRRRAWLIAGSSLLALTALAVAATVALRTEPASIVTIRFEVTGTTGAAVRILWRAPGDGLEEVLYDPALPWSKVVEVDARTGPLTLIVMTGDEQTATATCRISSGREVVEESGIHPHCFTTLQRIYASM